MINKLFPAFSSAPCGPQGLAVSTHCETSSATLSWSASQGSVNYYGLAHTSLGAKLSCETTGTTCNIEGLQCGMMYNFSVRASDGTCNSSLGQRLQIGAGNITYTYPVRYINEHVKESKNKLAETAPQG